MLGGDIERNPGPTSAQVQHQRTINETAERQQQNVRLQFV